MITRFFAKELIGFPEVEMHFSAGLSVLSGPSGSGKSVLMEGILSTLGYKDATASNAEVIYEGEIDGLNDIGVEKSDELTFRYLKKEKTRYFVNSHAVSKKDVSSLAQHITDYLSSKYTNDFDSATLCSLVDSFIDDTSFVALLRTFQEELLQLTRLETRLSELNEKRKNEADEKEFLRFELEKFTAINPREDEEEELEAIKKQLAKKDKIEALLKQVQMIPALSAHVGELFRFVNRDENCVESFFAELQEVLSEIDFRLSSLDGTDIDAVFTRLEQLAHITKRYGGVKEAVVFFENKKKELDAYLTLDADIDSLRIDIKRKHDELIKQARKIATFRQRALPDVNKRLALFCQKLSIASAQISFQETSLNKNGLFLASLIYDLNRDVSALSAGEQRRLRLAVMASAQKISDVHKILFLDEADANLSGQESAGVAFVLHELSKQHQVIAISHQPQLAAIADNHFKVDKHKGKSSVFLLDTPGRIEEIARMVSSGEINQEALEYAKKMIGVK